MGCATHALASKRSLRLLGGTCEPLQPSNTTFHDSVSRRAPRAFWWWRAWQWMMDDITPVDFFLLHPLFSILFLAKYTGFLSFVFFIQCDPYYFDFHYFFNLLLVYFVFNFIHFIWFLFQMRSSLFWFPIDFIF